MPIYRYVPNSFAKKKFNLVKSEYISPTGITSLIEKVLGKENYEKFIFAQDPFHEKKNEGEIKIILNPEEPDFHRHIRYSIGTVYMMQL